MKFKLLAEYFKQIEEVSSRLEITRLLGELFKKLTPDEYQMAVYLLEGQVAPQYVSRNFGMAEKMVVKAIASAMQLDTKEVSRQVGNIGDVGLVTETYKKEYISFESNDLTIKEVFDTLFAITDVSGDGAQDTKSAYLGSLIRQLDPLSTRYVVRIPIGQLRLGFSDMTILDALSWMKTGDKSLRPSLQSAYLVRPDLGYIGRTLIEKGIEEVEKIGPQVFTPILMMRAERLSSGEEIIATIGECLLEPKFDGFRLQIHKRGNEVKLYTRGLEDATFMYPDIVQGVLSEVSADSVIMEGEAIGYDKNADTFLPFQETVQRKRKYGIAEKALSVPLKLFAFDLLYCDDVSFINRPCEERRAELERIVGKTNTAQKHTILCAENTRVSDPLVIEQMFEDAIGRGLEGIIAKKRTGHYEPGARGWNWIKFKRSYSSKIDDTIDCLVMGYDQGKGKRAAFGIGAFLAGVYDEKADMFVTVAKIGTGLTDEEWKELKSRCDKLKSPDKSPRYDVDRLMKVDVWVAPEIIVEIKADEITRSPTHTAGRILQTSKSGTAFEVQTPGYALRFPRLERFRDDKRPTDVTTVEEVEHIYNANKK